MSGLSVQYDEIVVEKLKAELISYQVAVPADPIGTGFSALAALVAQVSGYKTRISQIWSDACEMKSKAEQQLNTVTWAYESQLDILLDTDPEIIALPSDRTRVARANKKLKTQLDMVHEATLISKQFDTFFKVVSNKFNNLEAVDRALKRQSDLYQRMAPPLASGNTTPAVVPGAVRTEI